MISCCLSLLCLVNYNHLPIVFPIMMFFEYGLILNKFVRQQFPIVQDFLCVNCLICCSSHLSRWDDEGGTGTADYDLTAFLDHLLLHDNILLLVLANDPILLILFIILHHSSLLARLDVLLMLLGCLDVEDFGHGAYLCTFHMLIRRGGLVWVLFAELSTGLISFVSL